MIDNNNINLLVCQECSRSWWCDQDLDTCDNLDIEDNYCWAEMSYYMYTENIIQWHHEELGDI